MKKPNQLRKILEQSHQDFVKNPDRLQLYVDGGQVVATGSTSLSFEYRYTLNIIITDFAFDIASLIVPINAYLRKNQPELFEKEKGCSRDGAAENRPKQLFTKNTGLC